MRNILNVLVSIGLLSLIFSINNSVLAQNTFRTRCPYQVESWPYPTTGNWMGCPPARYLSQNGSPCPLENIIKPWQDCCGAQPICNITQNVTNQGFGARSIFNSAICGQGCSNQDLPPQGEACFGANERQTAWYTFRIGALPGGSSVFGSSAGKLRFRIIPCDLPPNSSDCDITQPCNCDLIDTATNFLCNDLGNGNLGNSDIDWMLFKVNDFRTRRAACNSISSSNSTVICCNWSSYKGPTGMFELDTFQPSCNTGALGIRYSGTVNVNVGDVFMLAVDVFDSYNRPKSYKLDFRGGCANLPLFGPTANIIFDDENLGNSSFADINEISSPLDSCSISGFNFSFTQSQINETITSNKFKLYRLNERGFYADSNFIVETVLPINSPVTASEWSLRTSNMPVGTYRLRFRDSVQSFCGLVIKSDTFTFNVGPLPPTISTVGVVDNCFLQPTILSVTDTNYYDFVWSNGSTANSTSVIGAGIYSVSARRRGAICNERAIGFFTNVQPNLRNCPISININNRFDSLIASLSALSYQWELEGDLISPDSRNIPVSGNGSYRVRAINNTDTGVWSAPFLVTNTREELMISTLKVYPNPAKGMVFVQVPANAQIVELISPSGKVLLSKPVKESATLNVQGFPKGTYIVRTYVGTQGFSAILMVQ